jgi:peptide/nickel transport system substrate-binding protein
VFHLSVPDPDFLYELTSFAFTAPIPRGVPDHTGRTPVPGTGPYRVASIGRREVRLVRNPYFREWSHAAQPDGYPDVILWRIGGTHEKVVDSIVHGRADWTFDLIPPAQLRVLRRLYPAQVHATPWFLVQFFSLNTNLRPFDDVRVRRALDLAVDRAKIVEMYGGPAVAYPLCQPLVPGMPGYRRYCPYTVDPTRDGRWKGPDLARARRLVAASGRRGELVTVWGSTDELAIPRALPGYIARVLRSLGFRTRLHVVPFDSITNEMRRGIQLETDGDWLPDYPLPSSYLPSFFSCDGPYGNGYYCDRALDRLMARAKSLQLTDPARSATLWERVDHTIVDRALWVPLVNPLGVDLVSARIRNYQFHPVWGFLADQAWLR